MAEGSIFSEKLSILSSLPSKVNTPPLSEEYPVPSVKDPLKEPVNEYVEYF